MEKIKAGLWTVKEVSEHYGFGESVIQRFIDESIIPSAGPEEEQGLICPTVMEDFFSSLDGKKIDLNDMVIKPL